MPFLRNVTRGRDIPEDRLQLVADQYLQFGGRSPINDQNRALLEALRVEMDAHGLDLPLYWGNRNWAPYLADAVGQMVADGRKHAVAVVTSAYSSYSSCRQYRENIAAATDAQPSPIRIDKVGQFYDEPGFFLPFVAGLIDQYERALASHPSERIAVAFTAHSIPSALAGSCRYEDQLRRTAQTIAELAGIECRWDLVFQSRSGAPHVPWLEPDINDHIASLQGNGVRSVITVPIGFLSDHQEVIYDLDHTAANTAANLDVDFARVATPGTDAGFVAMLRERIQRHVAGEDTLRCLGDACCPAPARR
jgi:ferrochelatase